MAASTSDVDAFFERLDYLLFKRRWSRADLARDAGINVNTLQNFWKRPAKYHPRADYVLKMANALGTTMEYLMTGTEPSATNDRPVITEITRSLADLTDDELAEIRGVIRHHVSTHLRPAGSK